MEQSFFYKVNPDGSIIGAYRLTVDDDTEMLKDEIWTENGWVDSNYAVVGFLVDGGTDFEEVSEAQAREITPKIFEVPMQKMSLVSKAVDENRYTLGPMYIPDSLDAHGEWTDSVELQKSVWEYVRKNDRRIRLQHNKEVVAGEWVEVMAWPYEVSVPMQKADGSMAETSFPKDTVFLGVVWEPWAWEMIKAGNLRGYSIGGRAQRLEVDLPMGKEDAPVVSGPTVNTVHEDTVMGTSPKKPKKKMGM